MPRIFLILLCLICSACGSSHKTVPQNMASLNETMLTEEDFKHAVTHYLQSGGGPAVSTYDIVMTDLNGDYIPEGLVIMNTPFGTWCHNAGCTLLIFEAKKYRIEGQEEDYRKITLNSRIEPIRTPLFIHNAEGQKWKTILVQQDGLNRDARYIELKNEGRGYPAFTLNAPSYHGNNPHSGQSYFY